MKLKVIIENLQLLLITFQTRTKYCFIVRTTKLSDQQFFEPKNKNNKFHHCKQKLFLIREFSGPSPSAISQKNLVYAKILYKIKYAEDRPRIHE